MGKVSEYIKFRAETLRMLAFALSIPFGHFMLGLILKKFEINDLVFQPHFLFSVFLIYIANILIVYFIKSIKDRGKK